MAVPHTTSPAAKTATPQPSAGAGPARSIHEALAVREKMLTATGAANATA